MKENLENVFEQEEKLTEHFDKKTSKNESKAKFNPDKNYRWEPGSQFLLSGDEFGLIINSLRGLISTPEAQRILLAQRACMAMDNSLARAVEIGVATEIEKEKK